MQQTFDYSATMAKNHKQLTADLLREIVMFIGPLSNEKKREYKQYMLKVTPLPIIGNITKF